MPSPSSSVPHPTTVPASDSDTENFLAPIPSSPTAPASTASSQDTTKPDSPVASRNAPPPTSVPAAAAAEPPLPSGALPPQVTAMLTEITTTLSDTFPTYPPHTIQRLAELLLAPNHHYKSLPTYLHALDRVVHVTSGLNVYPLPPAVPDASSVSLLLPNGASDTILPSPFAAPGSDEALGGALLTPIPWLQTTGPPARAPSPQPQTDSSSSSAASAAAERANDAEAELRTESTETIDGPNGMGSIETVTVTLNGVPSMGARGVGVTQGELLRQEQRAGVVPVSQLVPTHHIHHSHHGLLQQQPQPQQQSPSQQQQSPASASSTTSSAALGQTSSASDKDGDTEGDAAAASTTGASEDEKPHARGPEEIGPEDMGPQRETNTQANYTAGSGADMQGIDVEAAVGRKADETRTSPEESEKDLESVADPTSQPDADGMEGVETGPGRVKSSTPKREAEDELAGTSKKLRDDADGSNAPDHDVAGERKNEKAREAKGGAEGDDGA